jgi:hypothetical protein
MTSTLPSIHDIKLDEIKIKPGAQGRVFVNQGRGEVRATLGSKSELLSAPFGLSERYPGAPDTARRTLTVVGTEEIQRSIDALWDRVCSDPLTPGWATNLESAMRDGDIKVKVDDSTHITTPNGTGDMKDLNPGCQVAVAFKLSNPWSVTTKEGKKINGMSLIATDILVTPGDAPVEAPKAKRVKW